MTYLVQAAGQEPYRLHRSITRIGSQPSCDVCLTAPGVIEDHAQVVRDGDAFILVSVGRRARVRVNGRDTRRWQLQEGDQIEVGPVLVRFTATPPADAPELPATSQLAAYREVVGFCTRLMGNDGLDGLLIALVDSLVELSHADHGFLLLCDGDAPRVVVSRSRMREDVRTERSALSDSIVRKVVATRRAVLLSNAADDAEFKAKESVLDWQISSVMGVPLLAGEELLGLIYLGSNTVANLFTPTMLEVATVLAALASLLVRNAMLLDTLRADNALLRRAMSDKRFGEVLGASPAMQALYQRIRRVAPTDIAVFITGETGTGKELVAGEIHRRSGRADGPFVVVNCAAIVEGLLESELFGHVRGAFTGAVASRQGRFQAADGGTLFLDEIGEMSLSLQAKLLRVLQDRVVCRVGEGQPQAVDIRIVAATNRDLEALVAAGKFREDLYYRLNVVSLHLPPLRDRGEDVLLIAHALRQRLSNQYNPKVRGFAAETLAMMRKHRWPGNIRQLENRVKKAVVMADHALLTPADMEFDAGAIDDVVPLSAAKEAFARAYINHALERNGGNRTRAAADLGVDPRTIFRHLERQDEAEDRP